VAESDFSGKFVFGRKWPNTAMKVVPGLEMA